MGPIINFFKLRCWPTACSIHGARRCAQTSFDATVTHHDTVPAGPVSSSMRACCTNGHMVYRRGSGWGIDSSPAAGRVPGRRCLCVLHPFGRACATRRSSLHLTPGIPLRMLFLCFWHCFFVHGILAVLVSCFQVSCAAGHCRSPGIPLDDPSSLHSHRQDSIRTPKNVSV